MGLHIEKNIIKKIEKKKTISKSTIIDLLVSHGLDIDSFISSKLYNNVNFSCLADDIKGKIFGYRLELRGPKNTHGIPSFGPYRKVKIPVDYMMDLDSLRCELKDETLILSDKNKRYVYEIDEHSIITVNGKHVPFVISVFTAEEINDSRADLYNRNKSYRRRNESSLKRSYDLGKDFTSD